MFIKEAGAFSVFSLCAMSLCYSDRECKLNKVCSIHCTCVENVTVEGKVSRIKTAASSENADRMEKQYITDHMREGLSCG